MNLLLFVLFFLLMCISLFLLLIGLINPRLVLKWGKTKNRKRVLGYYVPSAILFFFISGYFASLDYTPTNENNVATESVKKEGKKKADGKAEKEEKAKKEAEKKAIAKEKDEAKAKKESEKPVIAQTSVVGSASSEKDSKISKKKDNSSEIKKLFIDAANMCKTEKWENCGKISKDILGITKENGDAYLLSGISKTGLLATGPLLNVKDYRGVSMLNLIREAQNASTLEEALEQSNQIKKILKAAISNNKVMINTSSDIESEYKKAKSINDEVGEEYNTLIASTSVIKKYTILENKYLSYAQKMNTYLKDWITYSIEWNEAHFKDDEDGMDKAWNKMNELENKIDVYEEKLIKSRDELNSFAEKSEVNWDIADQESEKFLETVLDKYN
jgi:hypothetical protein